MEIDNSRFSHKDFDEKLDFIEDTLRKLEIDAKKLIQSVSARDRDSIAHINSHLRQPICDLLHLIVNVNAHIDTNEEAQPEADSMDNFEKRMELRDNLEEQIEVLDGAVSSIAWLFIDATHNNIKMTDQAYRLLPIVERINAIWKSALLKPLH